MQTKVIDHTVQVKSALNSGIHNGLWAVGATAEGYAKDKTPVDTGRLRNSITHAEDDKDHVVFVGTNMEYAPYIELGTGIYATEGLGRQDGWAYTDRNGEVRFTRGNKPAHMLRDAIQDHLDEYEKLIADALKASMK